MAQRGWGHLPAREACLGADVAAYVDGQLSPEATVEADDHLERCERCRHAVSQQRMLKARMSGTPVPQPHADLLASLDAVPASGPRVRSVLPGTIAAMAVVFGASAAVLAAAYVFAPNPRAADPVAPQFNRFAAVASSFARPRKHLTTAAMDSLDDAGWPSREDLGLGFYRVDGHLHDGHEVVAQAYVGRGETLMLFEQVGTLDDASLKAFQRRVVADRPVWVREGRPRIITWDADGMIYTLVTQIPDTRLAELLGNLPAPPPPPSPIDRVGAGLVRMSSWLS